MYKERSVLLLFIYIGILLPMNLIGHGFQIPVLEVISKPLLLLVLVGYFLLRTHSYKSRLRTPIVLALMFSWMGDIALMFDHKYDLMFMVGLGCFLVAHLHYVYVFIQSYNHSRFSSKQNRVWIPLLFMYTVMLINFLWPSLGDLRIPVLVYALVLLSMGITALLRDVEIGYHWVLFGALLFITSDSILAINKFHTPIELGGVFVMLTYGLAQLFIVLGVCKTIIRSS